MSCPRPDPGLRLAESLAGLDRVVVAFSGGVDSSVLAHAALGVLGAQRVQAVTADSASLAAGELGRCRGMAERWGLPWRSVHTDELGDPRYVANGADRCARCKTALMDRLEPIASELGATIVLGVNLDDLGDHRPGQVVAAQRGARFPLVEAAMTKADVRRVAQGAGLSVWDRPAMPCLSSRIPYGTPVSVEVLGRVDRAERAVRAMGFGDVRVRHYGDTARVELPLCDLPDATARADELDRAVRAAGYRQVTVDPAGLRSGNLNAALRTTGAPER